MGPGGSGWPDEPWWKLSGLFDLTFEQSIQAGVAELEKVMADHPDDHLVVYGYSQGALIAIRDKRKLAEQYPDGTQAPDIDFVLSGDPSLPNGGLLARFPGLYIPILDIAFTGPEPTDTQFHTDVITRQYDAAADFPLYPLNLLADLNAVLGAFYVHLNDFDVSLPPDPTKSKSFVAGNDLIDTDYYFFETEDLPLFAPLRSLGVPEPLIDVVEPLTRWAVELGYDRTIPPWEPTPARLIPVHDPATVIGDFIKAIGEGIDNALALFGAPPLPNVATPGGDSVKSDIALDARIPHDRAELDRAVVRDEARETGWKAREDDSDGFGWKRGPRVRNGNQAASDEGGRHDRLGHKRGLGTGPDPKAGHDDLSAGLTFHRGNRNAQATDAHDS